MIRLGVNIDHVATVRQARGIDIPDPLEAALLAELGGADGITVHLREDRRHIQERDVERLRGKIKTKLNLEMAATPEMVSLAEKLRPTTPASCLSGARSLRPRAVWTCGRKRAASGMRSSVCRREESG